MIRHAFVLALAAAGCDGATPAAAPDASVAPDASTLPPGVIAVPTSGCSWSFTGTFAIGGAPFRLWIDTGSNILAVAGSNCTDCTAGGVQDLYTPGPTATDEHHMGSATYDEGNMSWHGEEYADAVAIGGASARIQLYSITNETQFFAAGTCGQPDGILGMQGIGDGSLMTTLAATGMPQVFAIHECGTAGMLWLGGFDPGVTTAPPAYVPMVGQYTVTLTDVGIGGASIGLPASTYAPAIIDSGGPSIFLPTPAYAALVAQIAANPTFQEQFGTAAWFATDDCVSPSLTKAELDAQLPRLTLTFGTTSIDMAATDSYLTVFRGNGKTTYCRALIDGGASTWVDLGNSVVRSHLVVFDRDRLQIGFAPVPECF